MQLPQNSSRSMPIIPSAPQLCEYPGCRRPSFAQFEHNPQCQPHFIAACYEKLDEAAHLVKENKLGSKDLVTIRAFVEECAASAGSCSSQAHDLNNLRRAQLLDIVIAAAQLLTQMRRSPRVAKQVPLRLLGDPVSDPRIEDTVTQTVSQHGAMFEATCPYTRGEIVDIVRLDTGRSAIARIAWHQPVGPSQHRVAVEVLNRSNFWN
jgi:hypothetical protein